MKTKNILLLTIALICSTSVVIAQNNEQSAKIKKTIQASYSAKRTAEMPRDSAFKSDKLERYDIYDVNGETIEYCQYDGKGNIYEVTKYQKDQNENLLKETIYDFEGKLKRYYTSIVDRSGKIIELKKYNSEDELIYLQKNEYDTSGNITSITTNFPNLDEVFKIELKYNSKNEEIKRINYNPDGTVKDTRTYKYDINGNEIEVELVTFFGDYTKYISEYDTLNNLTVQNMYDKEGSRKHQTSFEYVYDKHGNWVTKKRFSNGELGFVWERKIEYY